ncbi:DNA internalization-related competence protein ComEC/Rec2 [Lachnospiraceae bacterium PM6-15]
MSTCVILFSLLWTLVVLGGRYYLEDIRPSPVRDYGKDKERVRVSGQVYDRLEAKDQQIFYLKNVQIKSQSHLMTERRLIVYCDQSVSVKIKNHLEITGKLSFYEEARNPGNYDLRFHYAKKGIYASVSAEEITVTEARYSLLGEGVYALKQRIEDMLVAGLGERNGQVINGILLGEKREIDPSLKETYQLSGIGHVLSISGLHISMIGMTLFGLIRRMTGSFKVAGGLGIVFLLGYSFLIGFSVSIFRATVMFLFRVGAEITGRKYDAYTAVAVAALLTVLVNPFALLSAGFYLSYLAILGLILLYPVVSDIPLPLILPGACVQIMLLGALSYSFFEVPLYSIFLNLLIIPLLSVIVALGIIGGVLGGVAIVGRPCFFITGKVLWLYEVLAEKTLHIPGARVINGKANVQVIVIYYILLAIFIWACHKHSFKKWIRLIALSGALFGGTFFIGHTCADNDLKIIFFDVGQGDGTLITTPGGQNILIDGGSTSVEELAKYRLEPTLKYYGIKKLDYVFVSHGDKDHYSGIKEMIEREAKSIPIATLIFPAYINADSELHELKNLAQKNGITCLFLDQGKGMEIDGVKLTGLHPERLYQDENAASLVLLLEYGKKSVLFTGDVEGEGEKALTKALIEADIDIDVLKVAHHGSKGSTSDEFLEQAKPELAIISAGKRNLYGHPHKETLSRLRERAIMIRRTDKEGAIILQIASR